jgi:hypothetical protein
MSGILSAGIEKTNDYKQINPYKTNVRIKTHKKEYLPGDICDHFLTPFQYCPDKTLKMKQTRESKEPLRKLGSYYFILLISLTPNQLYGIQACFYFPADFAVSCIA